MCIHIQVVNLGNDRPVRLMELVRVAETCVGKPARIHYRPEVKGAVPRTHANISKARCLLGYQPTTRLREGMASFVRWFQDENASRFATY